MIRSIILVASLLAGTAAVAQTPPAPAPRTASPADLAFGRDIAARLLPPGTYQRMMGGAMSQLMTGMTEQMTTMPVAPFLKSAGLLPADAAKLGQTTIKQIMDIVDPHYQERIRLVMPVMMQQMGEVMTQFEPQIRDGLAQAYATHFSSAQLADMDHFFNTPSGLAFAAQSMTIATDPAVMQKMQALMPALMQQMPAIMQKAQAAAASLPPPKTPDKLTDADRARLAQLLGVTPDKLKKAPTP